MKIVLLGYMASGKSTIGKKLASKKNVRFIDLDTYIEEKFNKTVSNIFKEKGEIFFRLQEHECLKELLNTNESLIIALGGGTPCYANNMDLIKNYDEANTFYIKLSINSIYKRLRSEKIQRPLVANIPDEDLPEFIAKHLFERSYFYEQASYKVVADNKSVEEVVSAVESLIPLNMQ